MPKPAEFARKIAREAASPSNARILKQDITAAIEFGAETLLHNGSLKETEIVRGMVELEKNLVPNLLADFRKRLLEYSEH